MKRVGVAIIGALGARWFFYVVLGMLVFQALWFVFSAMYPMAFDEEFHFGIIQIYAQQWLPFLDGQPEGADSFGAVARDPSFLFHYLMSFPYRFIDLFTDSQTIQVILLRLINVGMFTASFVLFRRVMLRAGSSKALANTALAISALIPIVPQVAAHINYDNLMLLLVAWMLLVVFNLVGSFRRAQVDVRSLLLFVVLAMAASMVKYAALPIVAAMVLFLGVMAYRNFDGGKKFLSALNKGYRQTGRLAKIVLLVSLVVGLGLFAERYGGNLVSYQNPVPDCADVLSVDQCLEYGPWARNYHYDLNADSDFQASSLVFTVEWLNGLHHRLFFAVNGVHDNYTNYLQLPVPSKAAVAIAALGTISMIIWWRKIFQHNAFLVLFLMVAVLYAGALWFTLYTGTYSETGRTAALNGRYLLPILLPLAVIWGKSIGIALKRLRAEYLKPYLAAGAIILFLYGGGVMTFILRSDEAWYWPNQGVVEVNKTAQDILSPVIIEGRKW